MLIRTSILSQSFKYLRSAASRRAAGREEPAGRLTIDSDWTWASTIFANYSHINHFPVIRTTKYRDRSCHLICKGKISPDYWPNRGYTDSLEHEVTRASPGVSDMWEWQVAVTLLLFL